jgi:ribosome-binding protein aMBF1 (putative translation factor)
MTKCFRCQVDENEIRLFDAIFDGRMISTCERCSIIENIEIIKKPSTNQLRESEKGLGVYERMKKISGIQEEKTSRYIDPKVRLSELNLNPNLERPLGEELNLIDHYEWELMRTRRRKGLSFKKLAEQIGESEIITEMIEKGKLPENSKKVILKLEQFLNIKLTKNNYNKIAEKKPDLLDVYGNRLEKIPEPEIVCETLTVEDSKTPLIQGQEITVCKSKIESEKPKNNRIVKILKRLKIQRDKKDDDYENYENHGEKAKDLDLISEEKKELLNDNNELDISRIDWDTTRISDLRSIHKKRIEISKQEKIEEQKRVEERQKLIEARREEFRQKKEKESKELDTLLGGSELLKDDYNEETSKTLG